ncbi:hypothetical protein IWX90DRAFT_74681 [Phyllosticta citrichinensis]|uniref:Uncharacterized protein n=1 Tax=Phyllosticta citrichinensis TaxID=1130410 RepID=A0ABR1XGF4_9PEZI
MCRLFPKSWKWETWLSSPQHNHPFRCNPEHVQSSTAEFEEPGTFEVREALQLHQGRRRGYHHVSGHINLIPGAADQVPQLIVNTTVWSSWPQTLDRRIATKTTDTALRLQLVSSGPPGEDDGDEDGDDDDDDDDDDEQECTFIRLNIAVAPNTTLSTLSIRSTHLSLSFYPDLAPAHLLVTNTTSIRLSRGAVAARAASSVPPARNTSIELASGAIAGVFPLVDLLCLSTQSGAVRASVVPYASSPLNRSSSSSSIPPAVLDASTQAGDLHVTFSAADGGAVPPRTYVTRARTASGALGGRFLLGQQTRLQSAVGALKAEILPVYSPRAVEGAGEDEEEEEEEEDYAHTLSTSTNAGSSQIRVLSPVAVSHPSSSPPPAHPPLTITTTHTSRTGFLRAVYPPAWRGAVCAVARIGHVKLGGEGVRVTRRERLGWVGSRVCGVKGDGVGGGAEEDGVDVQLSVQTGDVEFWVSSDGEGNEQGREWGDDGGEDAEL